MNRQFHITSDSCRRSPINTPANYSANYSTDYKNFTGHMFNIKLEQKPHKMSFKAPPVKIQIGLMFKSLVSHKF